MLRLHHLVAMASSFNAVVRQPFQRKIATALKLHIARPVEMRTERPHMQGVASA
jgi:hypothetical protein